MRRCIKTTAIEFLTEDWHPFTIISEEMVISADAMSKCHSSGIQIAFENNSLSFV